MIIHHYYPQRNNIGDTFVHDGIRKLFSGQWPGAEFVDFPVNKPCDKVEEFGLQGVNIEKNNQQADLVIIGGSNLYQCRKSGQWGVTTDLQSIRRLTKPLVLIGLGAGSSFGNTVRQCSPQSAEEMRELNRIAIASSVRDDAALAFLENLDIHNAVMTGCPATFVFDQTVMRFSDSTQVAITFPPARFRKKRLLFWRLMRTMRNYAAWCRQQGLSPLIVCHNDKDLPYVSLLNINAKDAFYSENTQDYYDLYSRCAWVVGNRLHASIICLSMGTPFIPIQFDQRASAFGQTYHAEHRMISGASWSLLNALKERSRQLLDKNAESFSEFIRWKQLHRETMHAFIADCKTKLI